MNACHRNQKRIALLALNALKEREVAKLRSHLDQCHGCHEYWRELAGICGEHQAAARELPEVIFNRRFHDRLVRRIHANESKTFGALAAGFLWHWFTGWRLAIPAGAIALLVLICRPGSTTRPGVGRPTSVASATPVAATTRDLPPTFSAYRTTANRSLDALDELLTRQGSRKPWAPEALRASVIGSGQLGD